MNLMTLLEMAHSAFGDRVGVQNGSHTLPYNVPGTLLRRHLRAALAGEAS